MQCWELIVAVVGTKRNLRGICVKLKKNHKALKSIELASLCVYYLWAQAIKKSALLLLSNCRGNGLQRTQRAVTLLFSCNHLLYLLGGAASTQTSQVAMGLVNQMNTMYPRADLRAWLVGILGCLQSHSVLKLDVLSLYSSAVQGCSLLVMGVLEGSQEIQLQWALCWVTHRLWAAPTA